MVPSPFQRCPKCGGILQVFTSEGSTTSSSMGLYQKCESCGAVWRIW